MNTFMQSQYEYFISKSTQEQTQIINDFRNEVRAYASELYEGDAARYLLGLDDYLIHEDKEKRIPKGIKIETCDGLIYCYDMENDEIVIVDATDEDNDVFFSLADRIANNALKGNKNLREIYLPCCKCIGDENFQGREALTEVTTPKLESLGRHTFPLVY